VETQGLIIRLSHIYLTHIFISKRKRIFVFEVGQNRRSKSKKRSEDRSIMSNRRFYLMSQKKKQFSGSR